MSIPDFKKADHTIIVSDLHLSDAEPNHPHNPLWKRFKRRKLFIDRSFKQFLRGVEKEVRNQGNRTPIELVLNGDIFDFDSVMKIPPSPSFSVNLLERLRGLSAEEKKSSFKISQILEDHNIWLDTLREFINNGNRIIFIIGNHDIELHWPEVQYTIISKLGLTPENEDQVRFCEWFYLSNKDTLIEHANQYDDYCVCVNPIHPLIKKGKDVFVRLPFGNLAGKYMINGMGLMNPHVDSSFIRPVKDWLIFFFRYLLRTHPLILWDYFWGSIVTLIYSVGDGLLPAMKDPLMVEARIESIAEKSNASPRVVRSLRELHVHPAIFSPIMIARELWLDRAFLLLVLFGASFQAFSVLNLMFSASFYWFVFFSVALMPLFLFYARSVTSQIYRLQGKIFGRVPISAQIAHVKRVIHGHTHVTRHTDIDGIEYMNPGTWSPAFQDVECTKPSNVKAFVWIRPSEVTEGRLGYLYSWKDSTYSLIHKTPFPKVRLRDLR